MRAINILLPVSLVLMILQGVLVMKHPGVSIKGRILGWLSVLFAVLAAIVSWFASEGQLILSPEFGAAMFQGPWYVEYVIYAFIVATVVGAGLGWYVTHIDRNSISPFPVLLICLVGIAFVAIQPYRVLNLEEVDQLHIHAYELWWPATLGWVVFCVSDSVFCVAGMRNIPLRIWLLATILGLLSLHALGRPSFIAAPTTQFCWEVVLRFCLILGAALPIIALYFHRQVTVIRRVQLWVAILSVVIGASYWLARREVGWLELPEKYLVSIFLIFPVYALIAGAVRLFRRRNTSQNLIQALKGIWERFSESWKSLFPLVLLLIFAASLADFLHFEILGALPALLIWILSLVALYEATLKRPLCTYAFGTWPSKGTFSETRLAQCFGICGKSARVVMKPIREKFWSLIKVDSWPKSIVAILSVFVILVALAEIPNAGKTIIEPFVVQSVLYDLETARAERGDSDPTKGKSPDSLFPAIAENKTEKSHTASEGDVAARLRTNLGAQISEKVRGKMIEYRPVLEPEIVPDLVQIEKKTKHDKSKSMLFAINENGMNTVTISSVPLVEVAGVKIPLQFLVAPIQTPVRALLKVRVIQGSLVYDAIGYTLTAHASTGESWSVREPQNGRSRNDDLLKKTQEIDSAIETLSSKLALQVLLNLGDDDSRKVHTESWQAFAELKEGFDAWQRFQSTNDYQELSDAIRHFQAAVSHDKNYPLAHYRLGLALLADHRASEALRSLQESTRAGADFTPGHLAAAQAWQLFEPYKPQPITAESLPPDHSSKTHQNEKESAEGNVASTANIPLNRRDNRFPAMEWGEVIKNCATKNCDFELPSASYGLCLYHQDQAVIEQKRSSSDSTNGNKETFDRLLGNAFYYCKRSAYLYAQLIRNKTLGPEIKQEWAGALNAMGVVVESLRGSNKIPLQQTNENSWNCREPPMLAYFTPKAREYYERATALLPDDTAIKCNWASAAAATKNAKPMQVLERDPMVHLTNALAISEDEYQDDIRRLRERIDHLEKTKNLDPNQVEALNTVAYTFWRWRRKNPFDAELFKHYGSDVLLNAEMDQRRAITVMRDGREPETGWMVNSTLGEILLAQARPIEAIEVLEKVVWQMDSPIGEDYGETKKIPKNPVWDEMRWDLAHAYLCAAANEKVAENLNRIGDVRLSHDSSQIQRWESKAAALLKDIRKNEQLLQDPRADSNALDPMRTRNVCQRSTLLGIERELKPKPADDYSVKIDY